MQPVSLFLLLFVVFSSVNASAYNHIVKPGMPASLYGTFELSALDERDLQIAVSCDRDKSNLRAHMVSPERWKVAYELSRYTVRLKNGIHRSAGIVNTSMLPVDETVWCGVAVYNPHPTLGIITPMDGELAMYLRPRPNALHASKSSLDLSCNNKEYSVEDSYVLSTSGPRPTVPIKYAIKGGSGLRLYFGEYGWAEGAKHDLDKLSPTRITVEMRCLGEKPGPRRWNLMMYIDVP